ncbi:MAG: hypothetical protein P1U63_04395 [Coxiellaceae bacterium]|nr:hypothetical protein [Coxiellaceae bacterium]
MREVKVGWLRYEVAEEIFEFIESDTPSDFDAAEGRLCHAHHYECGSWPYNRHISTVELCAKMGKLDHLEFMLDRFPTLIEAYGIKAFRASACEAQVDVMNMLWQRLSTAQKPHAFKAPYYEFFHGMVRVGTASDLVALCRLMVPSQIKAAVKSNDFGIFVESVCSGDKDKLNALWEMIDPADRPTVITSVIESKFIEKAFCHREQIQKMEEARQRCINSVTWLWPRMDETQQVALVRVLTNYKVYTGVGTCGKKPLDYSAVTLLHALRALAGDALINDCLKKSKYKNFTYAVMEQDTQTVKEYLDCLTLNGTNVIVDQHDADAMRDALLLAISQIRLPIVKILWSYMSPVQQQAILSYHQYAVMNYEADGRRSRTDILYAAFAGAADSANEELFDTVSSWMSAEQKAEAIDAYQFHGVVVAAEKGDIAYIERLRSLVDVDICMPLRNKQVEAFSIAAINAQLEVMSFLSQVMCPEDYCDAIQESSEAMGSSVRVTNYDVLYALWEVMNADQRASLENKNNAVGNFLYALKFERFDTRAAHFWWQLMTDDQRADKRIYELTLTENVIGVFKELPDLDEIAPSRYMEGMKARSFFGLQHDFDCQYREELWGWMKEETQKRVIERLSTVDGFFRCFLDAAHYCDDADALIPLYDWMKVHVPASALISGMQASISGLALRQYVSGLDKFFDVLPEVFAFAEMHVRELSGLTTTWLQSKLADWERQSEVLRVSGELGEFDLVDGLEATKAFFILRHLIRRNDEKDNDCIDFLIKIPSVNRMLHAAVQNGSNDGEINELLLLAYSVSNEYAARALLVVPAVFEIAQANNFYVDVLSGETCDLKAIAADAESSMRAVSKAGRNMLENVNLEYGVQVQMLGGIDAVINTIKNDLKQSYLKNPAMCEFDGKLRPLPFEWSELQVFLQGLEPDATARVMQAYYQHEDHTAFRLLSSPNRWMSDVASFVYIDDARVGRTAIIDDLKKYIAPLYLAAKDESVEAVDGHTIESRCLFYIKQLALINRAHNWDQCRTKMLPNGKTVMEYYDDLKGDKPSCYSGMLSRLAQSLLGHPLSRILTVEKLTQEIRDMVRVEFSQVFSTLGQAALAELKQAVDKMIDSGEVTAPLLQYNISPDAVAMFDQAMNKRWGKQYTDTPKMRQRLSKLVMDTESLKTNGQSHLTLLFSFAAIGGLLNSYAGVGAGEGRLFSLPRSSAPVSEASDGRVDQDQGVVESKLPYAL